MKEQSATGTTGFLIRGIDDKVWFRVYDKNHDFVDYDITHHDCEVTITDTSASFFRGAQGDFLDYSTESMEPTQRLTDQ